jgi:AraC-like DNA-binding protein
MISEPFLIRSKGPDFWAIHETRSTKAWAYPPHRHDGFGDLMLVCEGQVTNVVNGYTTEVYAGSVAWTRERDLHEIQGSSFRFLNLNLPDERLEILALALGRGKELEALKTQPSTPWARTGDKAAGLERSLTRLLTTPRGPLADLRVNELTVQLLAILLAPHLSVSRKPATQPEWLERGLKHIEQHIEDGVSVSELSSVCNRSPEHISRSFQHHLGMSPSAWINQQRITRASLLLSSTNREILDICYDVGFQSPSYFYRIFKTATGLPPKQYRNKHNPMSL